jgi:hypothetical protein
MNTAPITYANYKGEEIGLVDHGGGAKRPKPELSPFHKGWRVTGLPPGSQEKAEQDHATEIARVQDHNAAHPSNRIRVPKPWDAEFWLRTARGIAVRSKPYELPEAAQQCAEMAEKAGWLRVRVEAVKREGKA